MYASGKRNLGQSDDFGLDLTLNFPQDWEEVVSIDQADDNLVPESQSAAAAQEPVITQEDEEVVVPVKKAEGIPFGIIAAGALAAYLILKK